MYWSVVAADFDGDGLPDIAASYSQGDTPPHPGYVSVYLQDKASTGRFLAPTVYPVGNDPSALAAGDFDADGHTDLVTYNAILATNGAGVNDLSVLLQTPGAPGRFQPAQSCPIASASSAVARAPSQSVQSRATSMTPQAEAPASVCSALPLPEVFRVNVVHADLNGDGLADEILPHFGSVDPNCAEFFDCSAVGADVSVAFQNPAAPGTYLPAVSYPAAGFVAWVAVADMNRDGHTDLVIAQTDGLFIRYQDASRAGQFLAPVRIDR